MKQKPENDWTHGTWQGAEEARRAADRNLTLRQKLEWNARSLSFAGRLKKSSPKSAPDKSSRKTP